jgi:histidine triad (HIT) family protein
MATVFSKIIEGELPSYKVAEDDHHYAFLDINPLARGHTLAIPKQEVDYIFDLPDERYQSLFQFAKKVGRAIDNTVECERVGLTVVGLEVPHAHIHLIPINHIHDIDFSKSRVEMSEKEFEETARAINNNL